MAVIVGGQGQISAQEGPIVAQAKVLAWLSGISGNFEGPSGANTAHVHGGNGKGGFGIGK